VALFSIKHSRLPSYRQHRSDGATRQTAESGVSQRDYVARVAELNTILDRAQLENFTITNENRPLTDVAHELLVKAGWISN